MAAVVVQVCVDHRLNHELLRAQVRQRLERLGAAAERIYILNEVGGNVGANFGHTLDLLARGREPVVLCAVLHHDDCLAEREGLREPLEVSTRRVEALLAQRKITCRVLTGAIRTEHNHLLWSDEPAPRYQPFSFGVY
ncbi:MAG: hypothetical protein HYY02_11780 [Chloroflexi bacterium]|nr:hypothetical protein [Chloroflexota bacterium]